MVEPTAVATIQGLMQIPSGSRVTFAARVVQCRKYKGSPSCILGDESALIQVEGSEVLHWRLGQSFRIEHGITKRHSSGERCIHLDSESKVIPLEDPVWASAELKRTAKG